MSRQKRKKLQTNAAKMRERQRTKRRRLRGRQIAQEIVARRNRVGALRRRHRKQLIKELVASYRSAQYLRKSAGDWLEFCRHDEWNGFKNRPKPEDQQNSFKFVVRLFVGFGGKPATQRASLYYCALQPLFAANVPSRNLPRLLREAGGFKKLTKSRDTDDEADEAGGFEKLDKSHNTNDEAGDVEPEDKPAIIRILPNRHSEKLTETSVDDRVVLTVRIESVSSSHVDAKIVKVRTGPT